MKMALISLVIFSLFFAAFAQQKRSEKPVLLRADRTEEKVEETPAIPDPEKSREHLEIGNFYFGRNNFKAATDRYREAIRFDPKWHEPYARLVRSLEKQEAFAEAAQACEDFIQQNPSSEEVKYFRKRLGELEKKSAQRN